MTDDFLPEDLAEAKMSTKLVYRALADADEPLTNRQLKNRARCSGRGVRVGLNELDAHNLLVTYPAPDARQRQYTLPDG